MADRSLLCQAYCVFGGSKKAVSLTSPTTFQSDTNLSGMVMRRPIRVYSDIGPQLAAKRPAVSSSRRRRSPRRPRPSRLLSPTQPTLSTAHLRPRALTHIRRVGIPPPAPASNARTSGETARETAGGCRRSRGAGWRSGSPVDCCRGHGAALATEMSTRRAFGGRPREPAASVRRSEALAADGGWARGGAGPRRGLQPAGDPGSRPTSPAHRPAAAGREGDSDGWGEVRAPGSRPRSPRRAPGHLRARWGSSGGRAARQG